MAMAATICWARTSSGFLGIFVGSTAPASIRSATTVASSRSPRYLGKILAMLVAPTWWPALPTRLEAAGDRRRRFHLDDQVDSPHVDAEFERRRRHDRRQLAALEQLFDLHSLLSRHRSVMRPCDLFACEVVQFGTQLLGKAAGVGEHDGRLMGLDQLEDLRIDRRPDRAVADVHPDRC